MSRSRFVYVTYIRGSRERVWEALVRPDFTRAYWYGVRLDSSWQMGAPWKATAPDGRLIDTGEVVESEKPHRLVLAWRNELIPELREEGFSRCAFELELAGDAVKLTVTHEIDRPASKLIDSVAGGWPIILSSLKSLLETGKALEETAKWPESL